MSTTCINRNYTKYFIVHFRPNKHQVNVCILVQLFTFCVSN